MKSYDEVIRGTWMCLISDLSSHPSFEAPFLQEVRKEIASDMCSLRDRNWPDCSMYPPDVARRLIQVRDFGKRWVFADDKHDDATLSDACCKGFISSQTEVITSIPESPLIHMWLREARLVAKRILGEYSSLEHDTSCRFGKRAAVGVPAKKAYLFNKARTLTGSRKQFRRFGAVVGGDNLLYKVIAEYCGEPKHQDARSLSVVAVPKSYKAKRLIMPDTVTGGFNSAGLGKLIELRLREVGLDIRRSQEIHKRVARESSVTGRFATADMSKASDSISWPLMSRVLPHRWLREIRTDKIQFASLNGTVSRYQTVMGMGKGYTFPLQTLIFYSLLRSIANLLKRNATIMVYGDDLIYPTWMHRYVVALFPRVGLRLNLDKTFADVPRMFFSGPNLGGARVYKGCFRESCGGDYHCGIDVRPYSPEGHWDALTFSKSSCEALLYTVLNGLLVKWGVDEIPITLRFLLTEIQSLRFGGILVVPATNAVSAGLRLTHLPGIRALFQQEYTFREPTAVEETTVFASGAVGTLRRYEYMLLHEERSFVPVPSEMAYYWDKLRQAAQCEDVDAPRSFLARMILQEEKIRKDRIAIAEKRYHHVDAETETLVRRSVKYYIGRDGRRYDTPPKGVKYRVEVAEVPAVVSREATLGWSLIRRRCTYEDLTVS